MDDPRRLIDDPGGSAFARSLLASAKTDAPTPARRMRVAKRLGIAAALAAGTGAGSEAGALAAAAKLATVLIALGGAVGLAIWQSEPPAPAIVHRAPASHPAPAPPSARPAVPAAPERIAAPTAPTAPASVPAAPLAAPAAPGKVAPSSSAPKPPPRAPRQPIPAPRIATSPPVAATGDTEAAPPVAAPPEAEPPPAEPPPAAPAPAAVALTPSRLAAEVALVDRARAQFRAGDHAGALAAVADYHRQFANGDLDAEVDVVTLEILVAQRDVARARALATAFLARFPRSPLAQRVHSLLDRLPK